MKELPVNDIDSRSVKGKSAREMRIIKYNFDLESLQSVNKLSVKAGQSEKYIFRTKFYQF